MTSKTAPTWVQSGYRGRLDSEDETSSGSDWAADLNTGWTQDVDTVFRVRIAISETAGATYENTPQFTLQYNLGAGWLDVSTSGTAVLYVNSDNLTDDEQTTQQISSGSFQFGYVDENGTHTALLAMQSEVTEMEWVLSIDSGSVTDEDTIQLRAVLSGGTALNGGYTYTPTITVNEVAGPTPVYKDLAVQYDIRELVGKNLAAQFDILNLVGKATQLDWDIANLVGKSLQAVWDMDGAVGKSLQAVWDMSGAIGKSLVVQYDLLNLVGKDLQADWDLLVLVGKDFAAQWDLRQLAGKETALDWDITNLVGKDLQAVYDLANLVGKDCQAVYDLRSLVGKNLEAVYDVAGSTGKALAVVYDILEEAPEAEPGDVNEMYPQLLLHRVR